MTVEEQRLARVGWKMMSTAEQEAWAIRVCEELEVYRKALEPFLDRLPFWLDEGALNGRPENAWFEGSLTEEHTAALREACRLMGIDLDCAGGEGG